MKILETDKGIEIWHSYAHRDIFPSYLRDKIYSLGHKDPTKEEAMFETQTPAEAPVTTVSDNEFAKLVAAQPVTPEFDADGNLVGYITQDAEEPTAEDQIN